MTKYLTLALTGLMILLISCTKNVDNYIAPTSERTKAVCDGLFKIDPSTPLRPERRPGFTVNATALSSSSIKVAWKSKGQQSYTVEKLINGIWTSIHTCSCNSFTDINLSPSTSYSYKVNGAIATTTTLASSTPPSNITPVMFLDFDGDYVSGTSWNYSGPFTVNGSGLDQWEIDSIKNTFINEYKKYGINIIVTTDESLFLSTPSTRRQKVIFTETYEWFGTQAGGVAFVPSFGQEQPVFVFTSLLIYDVHNIIFASYHEAGHALDLWHVVDFCNQATGYSLGPNWLGGNYNYPIVNRVLETSVMDSRCLIINQPLVMKNTIGQ